MRRALRADETPRARRPLPRRGFASFVRTLVGDVLALPYVVSGILGVIHQLALALQLQTAVPVAHVAAAITAATPEVPAELLLAIAFVESRYDVTATSRVVRGVRRTGRYPSTEPPAGLDAHASLFCGPLQTYASTWSECMAQRDLAIAYAAAVRELEQWLGDRRVHGNVMRALAGHGCGNYGVVSGRCNGYPERVRAIQRRLEQPHAHSARPFT